MKVGYRIFDVQYVIPDDRLMHRPRPELWRVRGDDQLYVSELHSEAIRPGPALAFSGWTPDLHYFKGSGGGRVLPMYAGNDTSKPNIAPGLLTLLTQRLERPVSAEDFLAYVAAITAHPAFTERFAEDLRTPGVRVPLTVDKVLWQEGVALGRRILWLHTRGERCIDPEDGRPQGPPDVEDDGRRPLVTVAIPDTAVHYPDDLTYDPATETLSIGEGRIAPVSRAVVDYEVSGMNVLRKWFGYRRATRPQTRGQQSALDDIRPTTWPSRYTTDLLEVLRVLTLVTKAEPAQAELLEKVMEGQRITVADLVDAGVFPVPASAREPLPKLPRTKRSAEMQFDLPQG